MANINKNIIMQAGAAVANAANKAAGLSAATPEPGSIISVIQLVNGGRTIGPDALAHFTESVRNKLLSLLVSMEPIQSGSGTPSPDNVRPISGRTGLNVYVSPTQDQQDATTHAVDWSTKAGTVYGGTLDVVTGVLTVTMAIVDLGTLTWRRGSEHKFYAVTAGVVVYKPYTAQMLCDRYKFAGARSASPWYGDENELTCYYVGTKDARELYIHDPAYTDVTDFNTAMHGVHLVYELATPITYQLTPQDIITLVGDNYIWSDSGDVTITE